MVKAVAEVVVGLAMVVSLVMVVQLVVEEEEELMVLVLVMCDGVCAHGGGDIGGDCIGGS